MRKQNPASIEIYIDDKQHITFIPTLHTKIGYAQSIHYFRPLEPPYTLADMGNLLIQVLNDMRLEPVLNGGENIVPAYKIIAGGKGFLAFQRKRQMISVTFSERMKFEYWYRKKRGFGVEKSDKEIIVYLPFECDANEIGKAIDTIYFEVNGKHLNGSV